MNKEDRWDLFLREYLRNGNDQARAYVDCGAFAPSSFKSAQRAALRLLRHPAVIERLERLIGDGDRPELPPTRPEPDEDYLTPEELAQIDIDAQRVINEHKKIGLSKITDFVEWDNERSTVIPSQFIDPEKVGAIQSVKVVHSALTQETRVEIKLYDKVASLKELAALLGLKGEEENQDLLADIGKGISGLLAYERNRNNSDG